MKTEIFFNRIYIIKSLFEDDCKSGQIICNDILKHRVLRDNNFSYELINIKSKIELFEQMNKIESSILKYNWLPYIHFEVHGADDKSGIILNSMDLIRWEDLFKSLQSINIKCKNNLFISLATCYGAYMIRIYTNFLEPCPFYGYIGPYENLGEVDILNSYLEYFEALLDTRKFNYAIEALKNSNPKNSKEFNFLQCEIFFDILVKNLRIDYSDSKKRTAIVKNLMNTARIKYTKYRNLSNNKLRKEIERLIITNIDSKITQIKNVFCMLNIN